MRESAELQKVWGVHISWQSNRNRRQRSQWRCFNFKLLVWWLPLLVSVGSDMPHFHFKESSQMGHKNKWVFNRWRWRWGWSQYMSICHKSQATLFTTLEWICVLSTFIKGKISACLPTTTCYSHHSHLCLLVSSLLCPPACDSLCVPIPILPYSMPENIEHVPIHSMSNALC